MDRFEADFEWLEADEEAVGDAGVFLDGLRGRAPRWACDPGDTWAFLHEGQVRAVVEVGDAVGRQVLFSVRVELVGDLLRCEELDLGEGNALEGDAHFAPLVRRGPVGELAEAAADWVERVLNRPVVCDEWSWPGGTARMWTFADTGQLLAGGTQRIPPNLLPSLRPTRRHVRGVSLD